MPGVPITSERNSDASVAYLPDLIYTGGRFEEGPALVCNEGGGIVRLARGGKVSCRVVRMKNRAMLPGMVNAHSHAFQRVIRGRTERRTGGQDSFWTWREMMYSAATRLSPEDIYDASRTAFLEMALGGITAVGEFHYIHNAPGGEPYEDPNLMAKEVVRAARDVGLRIALLRVAYARPGHATESNPKQARFIEKDAGIYVRNLVRLSEDLERAGDSQAWAGVALHSVRALPPEYLREAARFLADEGSRFPVHMHVAEQPAEVSACLEEYGQTPVFALDALGLLNERFTAIHAIHITDEEARKLARASSHVCVCPTTERNLGDGVFSHAEAFLDDRRLALGTDSQAQVDLLEDARELELHMRLRTMGRAVLAPQHDDHASALARRLFDCATLGGASSIQSAGGELAPGRPADFFTVALDDPSIAGASAEDLLAAIVFSLERTAVREVFVGGRAIVEDGKHRAQEEIVGRFAALQKRLWG